MKLGSLTVNVFGLMIAAGFAAGLGLAIYQAKKRRLDPTKIIDLVVYSFLGGLIGARLGFVLFYNFEYYMRDPIAIIKIHEGGLSIHGGIIGGLVVGWYFVRKYKLTFWQTADLLAPSLILGQAIARIGCDVFGKPMINEWIWGVRIDGALLHPVQIYESLFNFGLFLWLWIAKDNKKYEGQLFSTYMIAFPIIRGIVELFRFNPQINGVSVAHLLSLGLILVGVLLKVYLRKEKFITKSPVTKSSGKILATVMVLMGAAGAVILYYSLYS